jgi:hypothetical protein
LIDFPYENIIEKSILYRDIFMGFFFSFLYILVHRKNVIIICLAHCPQVGTVEKLEDAHLLIDSSKKKRGKNP